MTYTGDVDLNEKLAEWQNFYNDHTIARSTPGQNTLRRAARETRMTDIVKWSSRGRIHHNGKNIGVRRAQRIGEREAELVSCELRP